MQNARLENWYVDKDDMLYGDVYGHPKIPDGAHVQTSRIVKFDKEKGEAITLNTNYVLGKELLKREKNK